MRSDSTGLCLTSLQLARISRPRQDEVLIWLNGTRLIADVRRAKKQWHEDHSLGRPGNSDLYIGDEEWTPKDKLALSRDC